MGLLAPLFLLGLAALAVPVIVHLFQRERRDPVRFPSLMFLRQVPYKSVRRRRIRNWPLFLLRSLAVILLALAFARPFLERDLRAAGPLDDAREIVLLVDRSYSMGYGDRWDRAVAAVAGVLQGMQREDRATLVAFDGAAQSLTETGTDPVRIRAAIDTLSPGHGITRITPALKVAQGILAGSERPHGEVVLISDFQRSAWDGDPGARLPAGARLVTMPVGDSATANAAVAAVDFQRETVGGRERITVAARIVSRGALGEIPVVLELNGREVQRRTVNLQQGGAMGVEFAPVTLDGAGARGTVRIQGDALSRDDTFSFSLSPGQAIGVLIVNGRRPDASLYLQRSLAIGDGPAFRVEAIPSSRLAAADLAGQTVVILNDVPFPAGETGRRLRALVERGGGLILAAGEAAAASWQQSGDLLPGTPGETRDRGTSGGGIGYVDYSSRVFELFRAPRSGDFTSPRYFRYRSLGGTLQEGVLARFDDGSPALVERRIGEGRVLVWASTFDTYWTDLPLHPVYLPFVHQLVRHAAGFSEPKPHFTVGDVVEIGRTGATARETAAPADSAASGAAAATSWIVMTPAGGRLNLENGLLQLDEAGFYEVRPERPEMGEAFVVAANVDVSESELAEMDPDALVAAVTPDGGADTRVARTAAPSAEDRERRQSLWWYLLIGAFALLAAETAWSNLQRTARRRPA